jgi:inorganic pyrophosphatase
MNLIRLSPGPKPPQNLYAIVEIPRGGRNKYEYDPKLQLFRLDRVLYSSVHYPANYGFVPGTKDGDPADILVMTSEPTFTGCFMEVRPVGLFQMRDEAGEDEKILSVPVIDPHYDEVRELEDVEHHFLREVEHFFRIYKDLEGKTVETLGWKGRKEAEQYVREAIKAHKDSMEGEKTLPGNRPQEYPS